MPDLTLNEAERVVEDRLTALLTLPEPPAALDARILAAARARAATITAASSSSEGSQPEVVVVEASAPAGGLLRVHRVLRIVRPMAAAAGLLLAGLVALQITHPETRHLSQATEASWSLSALGAARVIDAEGALGAGARAKLPESYVAEGEALHVRPGGFLELELACGTRLVLDGGSSGYLRFDRSTRGVHLERGRLYADVVKVGTRAAPNRPGGSPRQGAGGFGAAYTPDDRPLVVHAPGGATRVLGTQLVVKAAAARSQVTVREGVVELINHHGTSRVAAGHSGLLSGDAAPLARQVASVERHFRWMGKIQRGPRHPCEKPFGGVVGDDEPAIGSLTATVDGQPQRLRLERQAITTEVEDGLAHTTIEFVFKNMGSERLEGEFRFALPRGADLARYAVEQNGHLREGVVVEREQARRIYREQKREQRKTGLVEWNQGSAFTAKVFPIEPRAPKRIVIGYTSELSERDGVSRLVVPLVSEAARAHPPEHLSLRVRLSGPEATAPLRCPSHRVLQRWTPGGQELLLEAEDLSPRNDFVLELRQVEAPAVEARVEPTPDEPDSLLVRVRPPFGAGRHGWADGPLVVLCDASGSQAGTLKEVQLELLEGLLKRANPSEVRVFLGHVDAVELRPADTGPRADGLLSALWRAPSAGALDLSRCLHTLGRRLAPDAGATLVVIGDGLSTAGRRAPHQVLGALRALSREQVRRVVTVGLGTRIDEVALGGLAAERGGVFVTVRPGDDLGRKLDEVVGAIGEPVLSEVSVRLDLPGVMAQAPRRLRNLRRGETLTVSARRVGDAASGFVEVRGLLAGRPYRFRRPLSLTPVTASERLARRWARRQIDELTLQGPRAAEQVLDLGLRYGIVTDRTSLLVLEPNQLQRYRLKRKQTAKPAAQALVRLAKRSAPVRFRHLLLAALVKDPRNVEAKKLLRVRDPHEYLAGEAVSRRNTPSFAGLDNKKLRQPKLKQPPEQPLGYLQEEAEIAKGLPKGADLSKRSNETLNDTTDGRWQNDGGMTQVDPSSLDLSRVKKAVLDRLGKQQERLKNSAKLAEQKKEIAKRFDDLVQDARKDPSEDASPGLAKHRGRLAQRQKAIAPRERREAEKLLKRLETSGEYEQRKRLAAKLGKLRKEKERAQTTRGGESLTEHARSGFVRALKFEKLPQGGGGGGAGGVLTFEEARTATERLETFSRGKLESGFGRSTYELPGDAGRDRDEKLEPKFSYDGWGNLPSGGRYAATSSGKAPGAGDVWARSDRGEWSLYKESSVRQGQQQQQQRRSVSVNAAGKDYLEAVVGDGTREVKKDHYQTTILPESNKRLEEILSEEWKGDTAIPTATANFFSIRDVQKKAPEEASIRMDDSNMASGFQLLVGEEVGPVGRGNALLERGRRAEAVRAFSALVEDRPDDAGAHAQYAQALQRCGLPRAALDELAEAARLDPRPARLFALAHYASLTGQRALAERILIGLLRSKNTATQNRAKATLAGLYRAELKRGSRRAATLRTRLAALGR